MSKNVHTITSDGYVINKKTLVAKQLSELKKQLTITPQVDESYGENAESYEIFKETITTIIIPRYFGISKYGIPTYSFDMDKLHADFDFNAKLRGTQPEVSKYVINNLNTKGGGILQLHTGYGKTTMSLYIASQLKLKTLVLVHKSFLQDQWYERIQQFTNATIGMIRQKKTDVQGKDIVIGMLQSISQIDYDSEIFKDFGLLICDECFPEYTQVTTCNGLYSIKQLFELWKTNSEIPLIQSYNEQTGQFEYKKMTYAWEKKTNEMIRVHFKHDMIDCTPNHRFLTTNGYIEAKRLTDQYVLSNDTNKGKLHYLQVLHVEHIELDTPQCVYDIEVNDNHNFLVSNNKTVYSEVVHNCHHMGSKVFSKALQKVNPRYTIGLSATPKRKDGTTHVLNWFLGNVLVKAERIGDTAVYIKAFEYETDDPLFQEKKRWIKGSNKPKPDVVKMTTNLYKIGSRNKFIVDILNSLRKQDGRKTIVLSGRVEHLKQLKKMVDELIKIDVDNGNCIENEVKTGFYMGKMKDYELKESEEADIIFATYAMAEEGLDIDGLNTLVFATPKKDIIQSVGRIMRKPIEDGDTNPLVIDIIDNLSCFKIWGAKRLQYYRTKEYSISEYKAFNDKPISFRDYMVNAKIIDKNDNNIDLRKEYITSKFGQDTYDFEEEVDFPSFPDDMFNYKCDYDTMFTINHDYLNNPTKHQVEITYEPK